MKILVSKITQACKIVYYMAVTFWVIKVITYIPRQWRAFLTGDICTDNWTCDIVLKKIKTVYFRAPDLQGEWLVCYDWFEHQWTAVCHSQRTPRCSGKLKT